MMSITTKEQLYDFRNQLINILHKHICPSNWKHLSVVINPSPAKIMIQYVDVYKKEYCIDYQTPKEIASDFERNLFDALCKHHKDEEERLHDIINQLTIRLNQKMQPDNWQFLSIAPTSTASVLITFADVYKKVYFINNQTVEEITSDFERNLFEELYKLYRKGVIPNDSNH